MPEATEDLSANIEAAKRAAESDTDDAEIAADDVGATALAEELEADPAAKP